MSVPSTLRYLADLEQWEHTKPYQLLGRLDTGVAQNNLVLSTYDVTVHDAESAGLLHDFNSTGFQWIKHTMIESLEDNASIARHIESLGEAVKRALNADGVICFDWQMRSREVDLSKPQIRPVSTFVHVGKMQLLPTLLGLPDVTLIHEIDLTPQAAEDRIKFSFPERASEILDGRYRVLSLWHPLFGPIRDYPLAVCDSRSVLDDDLIESDFIYPNFESETFAVVHNPCHRWYYMKDQHSDDLLVITNFDSGSDLRVPHAGFQLPDDPTVTRKRESLEVRVVVWSSN